MFSSLIKNLSILKKFLFINLLIFIFIGTLTIIYLNYVQPNLIKKKTSLQIEVINNTINNLNRLKIEFEKNEVKNCDKRFSLFTSNMSANSIWGIIRSIPIPIPVISMTNIYICQ